MLFFNISIQITINRFLKRDIFVSSKLLFVLYVDKLMESSYFTFVELVFVTD